MNSHWPALASFSVATYVEGERERALKWPAAKGMQPKESMSVDDPTREREFSSDMSLEGEVGRLT